MVNVTWNDAVAFCEWLSHKEEENGSIGCRPKQNGSMRAAPEPTTRYWKDDDPEHLTQIANVRDLAAKQKFGMAEYAEFLGRLG